MSKKRNLRNTKAFKAKRKRNQYKPTIKTDNRVDMRTGGRVKYQKGGKSKGSGPIGNNTGNNQNDDDNLFDDSDSGLGSGGKDGNNPVFNEDVSTKVDDRENQVGATEENGGTSDEVGGSTTSDTEPFTNQGSQTNNNNQDGGLEGEQGRIDPYRTLRTQRTGKQAEQIAQGKIPDTMHTVPDAETIGREDTILDTEGFRMSDTVGAMAGDTGEVGQQFFQEGTVDEADAPDVVTQSLMKGVERVPTEDRTITAATREAVTLDPDIEGDITEGRPAARVDTTGTKAERVKGRLTAEAKAQTGEAVRQQGVSDAVAETREDIVISDEDLTALQNLAQERGINLKDILKDDFGKVGEREAQTATAATQKVDEKRIGDLTDEEKPEQAVADYYAADFTPEANNTEIDDVPSFKNKAAKREAQVGQAATRIAQELGEAPPIDLQGREAITGQPPIGTAAEIGGIPTMQAAQMQAVQGKQRTVAASDMMEVIGNIPESISSAVLEDPAVVEEKIDEQPVEVRAAVAALPREALVSTQMEGLLAGIEEGKTPAWARPAVAAVNQMMSRRGLATSTVGRDALLNAVIQSALPIAQSNAQALQQRAQQNLSNQQQATLEQARQSMQLRMQNLANRQTAASQTAQMAQQIRLRQGDFDQQAVLQSARDAQQVRTLNLQNRQARAVQLSAQQQQAAISTFNANAQMDLANLQAESNRAGRQLSADQQARLSTYNARIARIMRQAELNQDMEKANLAPALQVEMQRISELNASARDRMTAENQERLIGLQTLIDFRKTDAQFAQQMDLANMSNEQQMELAMLQDRAAMDTANFTAENQFRLTELNSIVQRNIRQADLDSRLEEVNLNASLKVELAELSERNTTSRANMTAEQQTRLTEIQTLVDFRKTNATLAQQMDLANLNNEQQIELALLSEKSAVDAANFTEDNRFRLAELNTTVQVLSQNQQLLQNADLAKLSSTEKVQLANLTELNRADSESMTAENQIELANLNKKMSAAQNNARLAQELGLAELSNAQQAAMTNAQLVANMDMAQFSSDQQTELANSRFMQTVSIENMSAEQQVIMQNATALAQMDLANLSVRERLQVESAKNFLTRDLANLSNEQQAVILQAQQEQQSLLSNQAAENARRQFNATSEMQVDQYMANLAQANEQFNTQQINSMQQFNATQFNAAQARNRANQLEENRLQAQLDSDISKFNAQQDFAREEFNTRNETAIAQSNVSWRRQANTIDTAAQNDVNRQNAQNAFGISSSAMNFLWQELRDEADFNFRRWDNEETRKASIYTAALGNDTGAAKESNWSTNLEAISTLIGGWLD